MLGAQVNRTRWAAVMPRIAVRLIKLAVLPKLATRIKKLAHHRYIGPAMWCSGKAELPYVKHMVCCVGRGDRVCWGPPSTSTEFISSYRSPSQLNIASIMTFRHSPPILPPRRKKSSGTYYVLIRDAAAAGVAKKLLASLPLPGPVRHVIWKVHSPDRPDHYHMITTQVYEQFSTIYLA